MRAFSQWINELLRIFYSHQLKQKNSHTVRDLHGSYCSIISFGITPWLEMSPALWCSL